MLTWGEIGRRFLEEQARHAAEWGEQSGLRFIKCKVWDTPLPDNIDQAGAASFFMSAGVRTAFLVGFGTPTVENEAITHTACGMTISEGITEDAEAELVHKILAAAGVIPYRKGRERYWIRWDGESARIEPAD